MTSKVLVNKSKILVVLFLLLLFLGIGHTVNAKEESLYLNLGYKEISSNEYYLLNNFSNNFSNRIPIFNNNTVDNSFYPVLFISQNPLELKKDINLSKIRVYYLQGPNWIEITENNNTNLPVDQSYLFEFVYQNIDVNDLINHGGELVYYGLPNWLINSNVGAVLYGEDIVGTIEVVDGVTTINFDNLWLEEHRGKLLNGTFRVSGTVDWTKVSDENGSFNYPDLDFSFNFENKLESKYGVLELTKEVGEIVKDGDKYYLEYYLTVFNKEKDFTIPKVEVKDNFENPDYIINYIGDNGNLTDTKNDLNPFETSNLSSIPGILTISNKNLNWNLGNLGPGESRTLTYFVELSDYYIDQQNNIPLNNNAEVYSNEILKDKDMASFVPKRGININKSSTEQLLDNSGSGTISYKIEIITPDDNTFDIRNITLTDFFNKDVIDYIGNEEIIFNIDSRDGTKTLSKAYSNGQVILYELSSIAPGEKVTITYSVKINNAFLNNNKSINFLNTATITYEDRILATSVAQVPLDKSIWTRKLVSDNPLENDENIDIEANEVYIYENGTISKKDGNIETQFTVPSGSLRYQVVINEDGLWNLSSANMTDTLSNNYLEYVGYLQINLYESNNLSSSSNLSDKEAAQQLENFTPSKTIWLNIDGRKDFKFNPSDLGIDQERFAFLLTYYAQSVGLKDIGAALVTNSFHLDGTATGSDGKTEVQIPGITVSIEKIVQGSLNYNAEKIGWYYEPEVKYFQVDESVYIQSEREEDYANGALYWVLKYEGIINTCEYKESSDQDSDIISGFYLNDIPKNSKFKRDSVLGVYKGPNNFDFNEYDSFQDFVNNSENSGLEKLKGNVQNDRWFKGTKVVDPDYQWFASNEELKALTFTAGFVNRYNADNTDKALYAVIRTSPNSPPLKNRANVNTYYNQLNIGFKEGSVPANQAQITYIPDFSMYKETKGAYKFDKENGSLDLCSNEGYGDWNYKKNINTDRLSNSGIYATWLLNINFDGTMEGTVDVIDQLPQGLELEYVDNQFIGKKVESNPPKTNYIETLRLNSDWKELESFNDGKRTISYYNKETNQIRWNISNLTKASKGADQGYEINLRIICKVTDPELLIGNVSKTYENIAFIIDPEIENPLDEANWIDRSAAKVTINNELDKSLDLSNNSEIKDNGEGLTGNLTYNRLPFTIDINPYSNDLWEGDILPTLIDELSSGMEPVESTIKVKVDEEEYHDFSYTIQTLENGSIEIRFNNLPDNQHIVITYEARLTVTPSTVLNSITNRAYWIHQERPELAQTELKNITYSPSGDVFTNSLPEININKVDSSNHQKKLKDAEFTLYEYTNEAFSEVAKAVTDQFGNISFKYSDDKKLKLDTVYKLEETKAPTGYDVDNHNHLFVILDPRLTDLQERILQYRSEFEGIEIWTDSPEYSCVIENTIKESKKPISIEKTFESEETPFGLYRFGLFEKPSSNGQLSIPVQVLTIIYSDNSPEYYLGTIDNKGTKIDSPTFSENNLDKIYVVYELDEHNKPVLDNSILTTNDNSYLVSYPEGNDATSGTVKKIINKKIDGSLSIPLTIIKEIKGDNPENSSFKFKITSEIQEGLVIPEELSINFDFDNDEPKTKDLTKQLTFTKSGTYEFNITEIRGENEHYSYDTTTYNVKVIINNNFELEELNINNESVSVLSPEITIKFINTYEVEQEETFIPTKTEVLPGNGKVVNVGDELKYEISWKNTESDVQDITIIDNLDPGVDFIEAPDGTYNKETHSVTWLLKEKEPKSEGTVSLTVKVNKKAHLNKDNQLVNKASVKVGNNSEVETNEVTNQVFDNEIVVEKYHKLDNQSKFHTDDNLVAVGDHVNYQLIVTNTNKGLIKNAVLEDSIPGYMTLDRSSFSGTFVRGDHSENGNDLEKIKTPIITKSDGKDSIIKWELGDLSSGDKVTIEFRVTVDKVITDTWWINHAYLTFDNFENSRNPGTFESIEELTSNLLPTKVLAAATAKASKLQNRTEHDSNYFIGIPTGLTIHHSPKAPEGHYRYTADVREYIEFNKKPDNSVNEDPSKTPGDSLEKEPTPSNPDQSEKPNEEKDPETSDNTESPEINNSDSTLSPGEQDSNNSSDNKDEGYYDFTESPSYGNSEKPDNKDNNSEKPEQSNSLVDSSLSDSNNKTNNTRVTNKNTGNTLNSSTSRTSVTSTESPKTGLQSPVGIFISIIVIALVVLIFTFLKFRADKKEDK